MLGLTLRIIGIMTLTVLISIGLFFADVNLLGIVASTGSFILWLPQAKIVWRNRKTPQVLAGVSLTTQWIVLVNAIIWAAYATAMQAFWSGAPGLINGPLAIITLFILTKARIAERETLQSSL